MAGLSRNSVRHLRNTFNAFDPSVLPVPYQKGLNMTNLLCFLFAVTLSVSLAVFSVSASAAMFMHAYCMYMDIFYGIGV